MIQPHITGGNPVSGWSYNSITFSVWDVTTNVYQSTQVLLIYPELINGDDFALEQVYPPTFGNGNWIVANNFHVLDANNAVLNLWLNYRWSEHTCPYYTNYHSESYSTYNGQANGQATLYQTKQ